MARDLFADPGRAARELAELSTRRLNLDPEGVQPAPRAEGWRIDDYRQALPREPAGPPVAGGSWEVACALLLDYDFVDPAIVRAAFRPADPLDGRDMLLELRLWGLRFHMGVRVVAVRDGRVADDGREAAVWGWSYATLDGHFEVGRMDYEVRKWLASGEVEFRIHAFSRVAHIPNPVVRLGFRVFGRRKQTQFARRACERMRRRTERAIASPPDGGVVVRPTW